MFTSGDLPKSVHARLIEAEQALKSSEARLQAVLQKSQATLIPAAGAKAANELWRCAPVAALLGYELEDYLSVGNDHVPVEDQLRLRRLGEELLERPDGRLTADFRGRHRDGSYRWVEVSLINLLGNPDVGAFVAYFREVTHRRQTEHELTQYRYVLEQAHAAAHLGTWTSGVRPEDPTFYSDECYRIFGLPAGQPLRVADFLRSVHPDDLPTVEQTMARAEQSGQSCCEAEYRIVRPGGEVRWLHAYAMIEPATAARVARMLGVVQDVTEERRAMDELRATELRYRRIVETTTEGVWTIDHEFRTTFMNQRMCEMLGYSLHETLGRTVFEFMPEEERPVALEVLQRGIKESVDFRYMHRDGSDLWVSIESNPLFDEQGNLEGVLGMFTDVTERRGAQEARNRLAAIVQSSDDAIISKDLAGTVVSWNRGAEKLFGYTAQEVLGRHIAMLVPDDLHEESRRAMERTRAGESIDGFETVRLRKDGTTVPVFLTLSPIHDVTGRVTGIASIARDLSEQKRAEAKLRRAEEQLYQAQKMDAIGSLAGGVAHDFNNLLSVVVGHASLVRDALPPDAAERPSIEEILRAADRAVVLTQQLLAFSRRQVLLPVALDLNEIVVDFERMFRRVAGEDIEIEVHTQTPLGRVLAERTQLEQVIMNLAVNARDAMPGGGTITIETANRTIDELYAAQHVNVKPGPYVVLKVSDTGHGIEKSVFDRIFEPFFTTKERGKGTGLGLSTVFGIVRQSGGHVTVESTPGQGSTFTLLFPESDRPLEQATPAPEVVVHTGDETILLVEDDEHVRALTRSVLRRSGYEVLEAQNAGEAVIISEQHEGKIHLVLSDVVMPRVSGRILAQRLSTARPDMKVMFMSGYADDPVKLQGVLEAGAAFLAKPVTPAELRVKVREVLDS
jgi:two-component system cell cycle sensor histidine kinase/response regulator CckA